MGDLPLRTPTDRRLGGPLPRQPANQTHAHPQASHLTTGRCRPLASSGVNPPFGGLSRSRGKVAYALLTRAPVVSGASSLLPLDLHVLGLSLAFILSQDQTLRCIKSSLFLFPRPGLFLRLSLGIDGRRLSPAPFPLYFFCCLDQFPQRSLFFVPPASRGGASLGKRVQRYNLFYSPPKLLETFFRGFS